MFFTLLTGKKENKTKGEPGSGDGADEITPPQSPV